jgi:hypothetical protein
MSLAFEEDPWRGTLARFPTVLHARASLLFDMNLETLQRAIIQALLEVQKVARPIEVTVADHDGYNIGKVYFRIGVGNELGFDILDGKMGERLLRRIEERGSFQSLDVAFHTGYGIADGKRHNLRGDRYIVRLQFRPGTVELLLHHLKGLRRIQPDELVHFLVSITSTELAKGGYPAVEVETLVTT